MKTQSKLEQDKKELLERRKTDIRLACEDLIREKLPITLENIQLKTGIPVKTLYKPYYKEEILKFEDENIKIDEEIKITMMKEKIKYMQSIIDKLVLENHSLKTQLLQFKI